MTKETEHVKQIQPQVITQWITSLAISVICCAILFIVFAGYIMELHETTNLLSVKLDLLQDRYNILQSEVIHLEAAQGERQAALPKQKPSLTAPATEGTPSSPVQSASEPAPDSPQEQGIIVPATGEGVNGDLMPPETDKEADKKILNETAPTPLADKKDSQASKDLDAVMDRLKKTPQQ